MPPPVDKSLEIKKKAVQKDEALRKKFEAELSRKRNFLTTQGQSGVKKTKTTAAKGTLAALKLAPALKVPETMTVTDISQLCAAKRTDCVLVVDDEESMTGIVTAKDLACVIADGLDPRVTLARQIMTRGPLFINDTSGATKALEMMVSNQIRHLPVCSDDGEIVGVLDIGTVFHETLGNAQRRSSASEKLYSAMAGIQEELGSDGSNSDMFAWAEMLREKTALPDLASIMGLRTQPVTVSPKTMVREVAQLMREKGASAVCVVEDTGPAPPRAALRVSRISGMFTSKDIVLRVIAPGLDALRCSVVRVMTPHPDTAHPNMTIHETVKKMYSGRYLNIPVVEEDGRVVAVVDILSLAEATQEQIKAANQGVSIPEAATGPMWGHFFESIREDSPIPSVIPSPPAMQHRAFSGQSDASLQPSDSASAVGNDSLLSASESDVASSKETTSTIFSGVSSAEGDNYSFKFHLPGNRTYKVKARYDNAKQLRETITAKIATDPLFNAESYAESALRPDPSDFQISYKDDDGDYVIITSDSDVVDAVEASRKDGTDRVALVLKGGKGWKTAGGDTDVKIAASTPIVGDDSEKPQDVEVVTPAPRPLPPPPSNPVSTPDLATAPIPGKSDLVTESDAPPEYTPSYEPRLPSADLSRLGLTEEDEAPTPKASLEAEGTNAHTTEVPLPPQTFLDVFEEISPPPCASLPVVEDQDLQEELDPKSNTHQEPSAREPQSEQETAADNIKALVKRLNTVFEDVVQYKRFLNRCHGTPAQKLLDLFQTLLDTPGLNAQFRRNLLVATQRLSKQAGLYPSCYNLEGIDLEGEHPVAAGGFADIYKGRFRGQVVCLKIIRIYQTSQVQLFLKQLSAEAILWGQLSHINLLPIYGLYSYDARLCLVAPWMENGDVTKFLEAHPDANRALLVLDIASGISYLHNEDIIHGDLKGANILVTSSKRACVADFGLSSVSDASILHWTSHSSAGSKGGSVRWQAPELFDVETDNIVLNTKASDIYAFSCVAYEIFTGNIPLFEHIRDAVVMLKVREGSQPSRPSPDSPAWGPWGLTEDVWSLMQQCWNADPKERPNILDIVAKHSATILVDDRPLDIQSVISPAHFRDSVGGRAELLSDADVAAILDGIDSPSEDETPLPASSMSS